MRDTSAKNAQNPAEIVITQEMVDIARESISDEMDTVPARPARIRFRRLHAVFQTVRHYFTHNKLLPQAPKSD